jgi:predicted AAA+ superfamily ATPase
MLGGDIMQVNRGAVAEQYVGGELRALSPANNRTSLFFWCREKQNSMAEVDYVFAHGGRIYPIEVKAGAEGTLKSLRLFLAEKNSLFGVRISQEKLSLCDKLLSVPLYLTGQLPRLIDEARRMA